MVECIAVRDGAISYVGGLDEITRVFELVGIQNFDLRFLKEGEMMLPGLIDSHVHLLQHGESLHSVALAGTKSIAEVVTRIREFIDTRPTPLGKDDLILGLGWDQNSWEGGQFPTAADLETGGLEGRKIWLKRVDVHALWISQALLDSLGPLPNEIEGGKIVRDDSGTATGVFIDNAMSLVTAKIPEWTREQRSLYLASTTEQLLSHGVTSVHDASLSLGDIDFLKRVDKKGALGMRIYGMVGCRPINTYCGDKIKRYDGDRFVLRAVKIFTDGALGSYGAAMLEDYTDNPGEKGILISDEEIFHPLIEKWINKGFQVNSHVIGDRAGKIIIDALDKIITNSSFIDTRPRLEHAQILRMEDIQRLAKLGVIASVQPTHATSDMYYAEDRIGPERIRGAYAWKTLLKNRVRLALGSDFPVESINTFLGIYAALSRTDVNGDSPHGAGGWYPKESLSLSQTLAGFTLDGAHASFQEKRVGSLEVGKEADFIIIDRDFYEIVERNKRRIAGGEAGVLGEILETKVRATIVQGKLVFGSL